MPNIGLEGGRRCHGSKFVTLTGRQSLLSQSELRCSPLAIAASACPVARGTVSLGTVPGRHLGLIRQTRSTSSGQCALQNALA